MGVVVTFGSMSDLQSVIDRERVFQAPSMYASIFAFSVASGLGG
jgi:hypothetical protein